MTVILLSGTPGTGKTTVAKILAKKLKYELIDVNAFAKKTGCIVGRDEKRKSDIVDTEKLAVEVGKLEGNYVVEGHLAHLCIGSFVFVLRCKIAELRKRLEGKKWPEKKVQENVDAEIMEVILDEALEAHQNVYEVDSSGTPEQAVKQIQQILSVVKKRQLYKSDSKKSSS